MWCPGAGALSVAWVLCLMPGEVGHFTYVIYFKNCLFLSFAHFPIVYLFSSCSNLCIKYMNLLSVIYIARI